MKQYFGKFSGRIAGIPNWHGGVFFTANRQLQQRIENHPRFHAGLITEVKQSQKPQEDAGSDAPTWREHVEGLKWNDLRALANDRGIALFHKKTVDLVEELVKLGE